MAISIVGTPTSSSGNNPTTIDWTLPSGYQAGDLILCWVYFRTEAKSISAGPSGYTTMFDRFDTGAGDSGRFYGFIEVATSGSMTAPQATATSSTNCTTLWGCVIIRDGRWNYGNGMGTADTPMQDGTAQTSYNAAAQNIAVPDHTTSTPGSIVFAFGGKSDDYNGTSPGSSGPTNFTELIDVSSTSGTDGGMSVAYYIPPSPGTISIDDFTITGTTSNATSLGGTYAIRRNPSNASSVVGSARSASGTAVRERAAKPGLAKSDDFKASGADASTFSERGLARIDDLVASGADESTFSESGAGITDRVISGANEKSVSRTGTGAIELTAAGTFARTVLQTGTAVIGRSGDTFAFRSGEAFLAPAASTSFNHFRAGEHATELSTGPDTNGLVASGSYVRERVKTGAAQSERAASGVRNVVWSESSWNQLFAKIVSSDLAGGDTFGTSVAVSGDGSVVVVGAIGEDGAGSSRGAVYVYRNGVETKLTASDAADNDIFGISVAVSDDGTVIAVGAQGDDSSRGSAYVYSGSNWSTQTKLTASDRAINDQFGNSIAISADGSIVAVGAQNEDGAGTSRGAVYVYSGTSWGTETKLTASDAVNSDNFGCSVAISDDGATIVIGAYRVNGAGADRGAVYVRYGASWGTETKLTASDAVDGDNLGWSVSTTGDASIIVGGAYGVNVGAGAAYVFSGANWTTQTKLTADDGALGDRYGWAVGVSGDGSRIIVGAYWDSAPDFQSGSIYVYPGPSWTTETKLVASDTTTNDQFGYAIAIRDDGQAAVVGARWEGGDTRGAAYIYQPIGLTGSAFGVSEHVEGGAADKTGAAAAEFTASGDGQVSDATSGIGISEGTASGAREIAVNKTGVAFSELFASAADAVTCAETGAGIIDHTERKLTASDTANDDYFGDSVATSGDGSVVVVGAYGEDGAGTDRGAIYVYRNGVETKLTASDTADNDWFGYSVAISHDGALVVVGASGADNGGTDRGSVYVFSGSNWSTQTKLTASDAADYDYFGGSVAISADGSVVVVGASDADGAGTDRGAVYVYTGTSWSTETKLTADDAADGDYFGNSLSISGDGSVIVVGAPYEDGAGTDRGAAYVYSGSSWSTETKLTADDAADNDYFSESSAVSYDGSVIVVGATGEDGAGTDRGAAYVYSGSSWSTETKLTASDAANSDLFGNSVAVSDDGSVVVVGAYFLSNGGAVYRYSGALWGTEKKLTSSDSKLADQFGYAVDVAGDGSAIVVGAPYVDGAGSSRGASYVYEFAGLLASGADAVTYVESGTAASAFTGSGADAFTASETGSGVASGFVGLGAKSVAFNKTGTAAAEFAGSGADETTHVETGAGVLDATVSGSNEHVAAGGTTYPKTGEALAEFAASAADAAEHDESGSGVAEFTASGGAATEHIRAGTATAVLVGAGEDAAIADETGAAILDLYAAGKGYAVAYLVPDGDINTGTWADAPLWQKIDEDAPSDADYIYSALSPGTPDVCEVSLTDAVDPNRHDGHQIAYRLGKDDANGDTIEFTIRLVQGTTVIASWTRTCPNVFTEYVETLTEGQAATITDYADLRLRLEAVKA